MSEMMNKIDFFLFFFLFYFIFFFFLNENIT